VALARHAILRNVVEQILTLLVTLHDNYEAVLLLQVVQDLDAVLDVAHLDHERDLQRDLPCGEDLRVGGGRARFQRRDIPLGDFGFQHHFDGHWLRVLASHASENGAEAALADPLSQRIMLVKQVAGLLLCQALISLKV